MLVKFVGECRTANSVISLFHITVFSWKWVTSSTKCPGEVLKGQLKGWSESVEHEDSDRTKYWWDGTVERTKETKWKRNAVKY